MSYLRKRTLTKPPTRSCRRSATTPSRVSSPTIFLARAKGIVAEAKGIHVPDGDNEGTARPRHDATQGSKGFGRERLPKQNKFPSMADYARFLEREGDIREGRLGEALEARRAEGKESAALGAPAEVKAEGVRPGEGGEHLAELSPEEEIIHREEEEERAKEEPEEISGKWDVPEDASKGDITRKLEAAKAIARDQSIGAEERDAAMRGVQRLQEALQREPEGRARPQIEVKEGEHYRVPKAAVAGFKQFKAGERQKVEGVERPKVTGKIKLREEPEGKETVTSADRNNNPIELTKLHPSITAREAIAKYSDLSRYSKELRPMVQRLIGALNRLAGDTKVHFVSREDVERIAGRPSQALYDPDFDHILINADRETLHDTPLHEVFHAATTKALEKDPELKGLVERLLDEALDKTKVREWPENIPIHEVMPFLENGGEEFLTGLMTNEHVQAAVKAIKISPELARAIGMPLWRKATMWNGVLHLISRALGLSPRDTPAIEAAMALTEKAMWQHEAHGAGMAMEAAGRLARRELRLRPEPSERDQEAFLRSPRETLSRVKDIDANVMKQYGKDTIHNLGGNVMRGSAKLLSGTWLNDIHGHLFTDAKGKIIEAINNARNKVSHLHSQLMDKDKDIINRGYMLDKLHASHMPNYARLLDLSQRYNIHADRDAPTIPKNPVDEARKNWQRDKFGDEARALYRSLPEELQKRYTAEKKHYMDKQAGMATAILDKILPMFDAPKGSTMDELMERAHKNEMTDDDWSHYEDLGIADRLHEAYQMANKKDVYFNSQRDGRYVVSGRYEMPKGGADHDYSGEELPDNQREFNTEADAHKYVTGTPLKATTRKINYYKDPATGEIKRVSSQEAASIGTITTKYRVSLERQNFQAASFARRSRAQPSGDGGGWGQGTLGSYGQARREILVEPELRRPAIAGAQA